MCWAIWKGRNELVWNQKHPHINAITASAMQYLESWRNAHVISSTTMFPNLLSGEGALTWVKPQESTIKVTVDASTFSEQNAFGIGIVARDHTGALILAKSASFNDRASSEFAEAIAVREALSWIKEEHWPEVIVQSDCLVVIQAIRSKAKMISPFGRIIEECREMLQASNTIRVLFIRRSPNMAVQGLIP